MTDKDSKEKVAAQATGADFRLRAHHGMCLQFFVGEGYSSDFTLNMSRLKAYLEENDPVVTLVAEDDNICAKCPNLMANGCESFDKVKNYDGRVLKTLGLEPGCRIRYSEFIKLVADSIIATGERKNICGDCEWTGLCG